MSPERDELVRRLERLPEEAWNPPEAPPLRIDIERPARPARAQRPW